MLTVVEASRAILERARPLSPRRRLLAEALGCVLAEDVAADLDLPPFDKALVDGYAVRSDDVTEPGCWLRLGEEILAGGVPSRPLAVGEAAAIMTGAPLPPGADAVVMIERTRRQGEGIVLDLAATAGQNRLLRGRELQTGDIVLRKGDRLHPVRLGLLASVGRPEVLVVPRPRIVVVPTGDELVEAERVPGPGQIRNSNGPMLAALASASDAEADAGPIAPDEPIALREAMLRGMEADVLLVTGGVSAGKRDLVPETLEGLGVAQVFHKVRVKPGKPIWFGVGPSRGETPGPLVFGLPGNPVGGVVGFLLFVKPALDVLAGRASDGPIVSHGRLGAPFQHRGDRPTYYPARRVLDDEGARIDPLDWAGSADLRTVAQADGFAVFPAGDRAFQAGETVGFLPMP